MKWLAAALLTVVLLLQYRLWLSGDGVSELFVSNEKTNDVSVFAKTGCLP